MARLTATLALALALAGCATPTASTSQDLALELAPRAIPYAFAGVPLLIVADVRAEGPGDAVRIDVVAPGMAVGARPAALEGSGIAEITVVPDVAQVEENVTVTVRATRGGEVDESTLSFVVADPMIPPGERAGEVRSAFVAWLEAEHPELGIDQNTVWVPAFARPNILVVSSFVFYGERWEMGVRWHVMIPPYDWGEIYLRERYEETSPSLAWKIDSMTAPEAKPYAVSPEAEVWR